MQPRYVRHNLRCISEMQLRCSRGEDHIALHRQAHCPVEWWAGSQLHWARPPLSGPRTGTSATVCLRPSAAPLPHLSYLGCTSAAPRLYLDQSRLHLCRTAAYAYDSPRHICLPISPHISPYLPISPHISRQRRPARLALLLVRALAARPSTRACAAGRVPDMTGTCPRHTSRRPARLRPRPRDPAAAAARRGGDARGGRGKFSPRSSRDPAER